MSVVPSPIFPPRGLVPTRMGPADLRIFMGQYRQGFLHHLHCFDSWQRALQQADDFGSAHPLWSDLRSRLGHLGLIDQLPLTEQSLPALRRSSVGFRSVEALDLEKKNLSDLGIEATCSRSSSAVEQARTDLYAEFTSSEEKRQAVREKMRLWAEEKLCSSREERNQVSEGANELNDIEAEEPEWDEKLRVAEERRAEEDRRWQQLRADWGDGDEDDDAPLLSQN